MACKISVEKFREIKVNQELFYYIRSNVHIIGSVDSMVIYNNPTFKFLMQILYFLPDDIAVDILNRCYFIFPIRDHGMHIPATHLGDRDIIVFNSFNDVTEKMIFKIMLHEIAHCHLNHRGQKTAEGREQREIEASAWADRMIESVY